MAMLSTQQAAERMGLADSTLRDWRAQHIGPRFVKFGQRCFRYDERDIDSYVDEHRYDPTARAKLETHAHR